MFTLFGISLLLAFEHVISMYTNSPYWLYTYWKYSKLKLNCHWNWYTTGTQTFSFSIMRGYISHYIQGVWLSSIMTRPRADWSFTLTVNFLIAYNHRIRGESFISCAEISPICVNEMHHRWTVNEVETDEIVSWDHHTNRNVTLQ